MKFSVPILLCMLSFLFGCEGAKETYLPPYSGRTGEVFVVMNDTYWDTEAGDAVRAAFQFPVAGLANAEYTFTTNQTAQERFGTLLKSHRNILIADIRDIDEYTEPSVLYRKSVWSNEQLVIEFRTRTASEFISLFQENQLRIVQTVNRTEKNRLLDKFYKQRNVNLKKTLEEKHKISLNLPKDFDIKVDTTLGDITFIWARREMERFLSGSSGGNHPVNENVIIYYYPYTDTATFSGDFQLDLRNYIGQQFVPGPTAGSYMSTERRYLIPVVRETVLDSSYAFQINGLWKLEGDYRGGPFVNVSVFDEANNRIITMDGTVYAPKFNKREYLREVEAMLYSLKIVE